VVVEGDAVVIPTEGWHNCGYKQKKRPRGINLRAFYFIVLKYI
jgi:hypothetical protein